MPSVVCALGLSVATASASTIKDNLYGVQALSAGAAVAVGNFGAIFRTNDGGKSWQAAKTGTHLPLFSVSFVDQKVGWAVGKSAIVLKTTDGGTTWTQQKTPIPADKHLFKVAAVDANTAWAVGDWGAITMTTDGGATWVDRSLGVLPVQATSDASRTGTTITDDVILYDVTFPDARTGYMAGEFGTVLATRDGGATWWRMNTGTSKTIFGIGFTSPKTGWVVGMDGLVLRTDDGGEAWTRQRGRADDEALDDVGFAETLKNPGLYAVRVTGDVGVIVGDTGLLLTSSDGGKSLEQLELPAKDRLTWIRDVSLTSDAKGFVVGASGFSALVDRTSVSLPGGQQATRSK